MTSECKPSPLFLFFKRMMDIVGCGLGILIILPFMIPIVIILRLTGEGEIFFCQKRVGLDGADFNLFKFATMLKNSPSSGSITVKDDPRILPLGRFLRTTKINELPQLLNVFFGDMSIVGPRPLVREGYDLYPEKIRPLIYDGVKPGLTGMGSLFFRNEEVLLVALNKERYDAYREDIMPLKGTLENWYREHRSVILDIKVIVLTAVSIVLPDQPWMARCFKDLPDLTPIFRLRESNLG